jgi:hypothetical protein
MDDFFGAISSAGDHKKGRSHERPERQASKSLLSRRARGGVWGLLLNWDIDGQFL